MKCAPSQLHRKCAEFLPHLLCPGGKDVDQVFDWNIPYDLPCVGKIAGQENCRACGCDERLVSHSKSDAAFDNVEELVFNLVYMHWNANAWQVRLLHQAVRCSTASMAAALQKVQSRWRTL